LNTIQTLPTDLRSVIGTEKIDFSILAKRKEPLNKNINSSKNIHIKSLETLDRFSVFKNL